MRRDDIALDALLACYCRLSREVHGDTYADALQVERSGGWFYVAIPHQHAFGRCVASTVFTRFSRRDLETAMSEMQAKLQLREGKGHV